MQQFTDQLKIVFVIQAYHIYPQEPKSHYSKIHEKKDRIVHSIFVRIWIQRVKILLSLVPKTNTTKNKQKKQGMIIHVFLNLR